VREDYHNLKQTMKLQALANYIVLEFNKFEQDEIIKHLQDPTQQVCVTITATGRVTQSTSDPTKNEGE